MLAAMAILLNVVEGLVIPPVVYGIRFGVANIIALITIELLDIKSMITVNTLRVLLGALIRGSIFQPAFFISASGVILSTIAIIILHKLKSSIIFKSIVSAILHSTGQILAVIFLYKQVSMVTVLLMLVLTSVITGFLTGYISSLILKRIKLR